MGNLHKRARGGGEMISTESRASSLGASRVYGAFTRALAASRSGEHGASGLGRELRLKKQKKTHTFWFVRKWDFSPETAEFLLSAQHDANISDGLNLHAHFAHEHLKVFDPDQRAPAGSKGKTTEQTYLMSSAQSRSCLGDASTRLCASVRDHCWDSEGVAQRRRHLTDFSSEKRSNC